VDPSAYAPGPPPEIVFATTNPHKLEEVCAVLEPMGFRVRGLGDVRATCGTIGSDLEAAEETGETFEENARIKARWYASRINLPCLADDSGLSVDALDGEPGVHSAYWAHGWEGRDRPREERDPANNERLLKAMEGVEGAARGARFVCVMCVADSSGRILAESRGEFEGAIATAARGENGFGYDPLLELDDGRTSAELSAEEKNARSHRGVATRAIAEHLARVMRPGMAPPGS
jgi:XTP/dITP diphosphohydrolase